jgi:hypothetical protein
MQQIVVRLFPEKVFSADVGQSTYVLELSSSDNIHAIVGRTIHRVDRRLPVNDRL